MIDYFEYIDDYMNGMLDKAQRKAFEIAMASDPKLAHAVENYPLLQTISASLIEDEVRETIAKINKKDQVNSQLSEANTTSMSIFKILSIAASFAILAVVTYFMFFNNEGSDEKLFAELYLRIPAASTRSGEETITSKLDSAIVYFDKDNLELAKNYFLQTPQNDSLILLSKRYLAHIALIQKDYGLAEKLFIDLKTNSSSQDDASYQLLTIYLITHKLDLAKQEFETLDEKKLIGKERRTKILELIGK